MPLGLFLRKYLNLYTNRRQPMDVQIRILRRLAHLLSQGYSLIRAFEFMELDPRSKGMIQRIKDELSTGVSLEESLDNLHFSKTVIAFLYFSKSNGNLEKTLQQCSLMMEQQKTYKAKFQKVIRYPLFLLFLVITLIIFVRTSLFPSFIQLYNSMDFHSLSLQRSLTIINVITVLIVFTFIALIIIWVLWPRIKKRMTTPGVINLYNKIPVWKSYTRLQTTYMFSYHLSSLLLSGMQIRKALIIIQDQAHYPILQYYATAIYQGLDQGYPVHKIIDSFTLMEDELTFLFKRNLQDGNLEKDLLAYADLLVERTEDKMLRLLTWIQPIMFGVFAFFIMIIYLSIMLPLFEWMSQI